MAFMNWDATYSVGIPSIDAEHQQLFAMVNELHDAMRAGKGKEAAPVILKKLQQYTVQHFSHEESFMKAAKYVGYPSHKVEHDKLVSQVDALMADFSKGKGTLTLDLLTFLHNWLKNHIMQSDQKYSPAFKAAKIQ
jgi:hemerythrin-like metal-binding protein